MMVWGSPPLLVKVRILVWLALAGVLGLTCWLTGLSVLPFVSVIVGVACVPCRTSLPHEGRLRVRWLFWFVEFALSDLDGVALGETRAFWPLARWGLTTRIREGVKLSIFGGQSELMALERLLQLPGNSEDAVVLSGKEVGGRPLILVALGALFLGLLSGYLALVVLTGV